MIQDFNFLFHSMTYVDLSFLDLDIDFETGLKLDENGYLDPVVKQIHIDFGRTKYHSKLTSPQTILMN